jgi:hypothetical protein
MGRFGKAALLALAAVVAAVFAPTAMATTPLEITKTAEGHWTRTFEWTIDKSVTPDSHSLQTGQSGTSTYTVAVTKSAGTDSIWVDGEVCVTNNGDVPTENLTVEDRVIAFHDGGQRTLIKLTPIDLSSNPVLDPGESACYPYSFPLVPFPGATGYQNEARATITNDPRGPEPLGPSTEAPFTIPATPTLVNDTVNVDDTNGMSWPFSSSGSQTYTKTFTCDKDEGTHDNTATIVETGQSDSASVTVTCTPPPPPGCTRTLGYWKTHSTYGPAAKPDATWNLVGGPDAAFFSSGKSWYQLFWTSPSGGNAYIILAHQYMAARLNVLAGAASTPEVDSAIAWATTFFSTYTPSSSLSKAVRKQALAYADLLDDYNNGEIGPGHCD